MQIREFRLGDQPAFEVEVEGRRVTVLGTAHVSRASAETVEAELATGKYDAVAVELCPSRYQTLRDPDRLARMNLLQVVRQGKAPMVMASLALSAYQQRLAEQFGIEPGMEMRVALESADAHELPIELVDRELGVTLKRIYRGVSLWRRWTLLVGLIGSVMSRQQVSEEEIERLKEGDLLETTFSQFADQAKDLFRPLIDERDQYMTAKLRDLLAQKDYQHLFVIVGAGHLAGMRRYLLEQHAPPATVITSLDESPPPRRWPRLIPWLIVGLIVLGFVIGFQRSPEMGWAMVRDWVLINGGLSALGALIAMAHPLTILTAFIAAPLTSLNPMIGAGVVTGASELMLRKPSVDDFAALRHDTTHLRGWWRNRVAHVLVVFFLSTMGSALGTYIAGYMIFDRLTG